jgi:hypothetical protein
MYPDKIIMHHSLTKDSGTVSWNAIRKYHMGVKGWDDIGYHYGIEVIDGRHEILVGRLMTEQGAHTKGQNGSSLGICLVGNFDVERPVKEMWDLAVSLVDSLCSILYITSNSVYSHNRYAPDRSCPGKVFNMDRFRDDVSKH